MDFWGLPEIVIQNIGGSYPEVSTFAGLPVGQSAGTIYAVTTTTGIWPFRKNAGLYRFDGSDWKPLPSARNLGEISDVSISSPSDLQYLGYNSASGGWENKVLSGIGGETLSSAGNLISTGSDVTTPDDTDYFAIRNHTGGLLAKLSWANIKTALAALFAPIASPTFTGKVTIPAQSVGFSTTATSGGTTTLTANSTTYNIFTGTQNHTVQLPSATTLTTGHRFMIDNDSTQTIQIKDGGANDIWVIAPGCDLYLTCSGIGSTAGTWEKDYSSAKAASGKALTISNTLTLTGTDGSTVNTATLMHTGDYNLNTLSGDTTFNGANGLSQWTGALSGNLTNITLSNLSAGAVYKWLIQQHASAAKTLAFSTTIKWAENIAPDISTVDKKYILTFVSLNSVIYGDWREKFPV